MTNWLFNIATVLLGTVLLYTMAQLGGVAVELLLWDLAYTGEVVMADAASIEVKSLMRHHGVQFFDWNTDLKEYGFWRNGVWCPAVGQKKHNPQTKPTKKGVFKQWR